MFFEDEQAAQFPELFLCMYTNTENLSKNIEKTIEQVFKLIKNVDIHQELCYTINKIKMMRKSFIEAKPSGREGNLTVSPW